MIADIYPPSEHGYPAANYLLTDDAGRPSFHADLRRTTAEPAIVIVGAGFAGLSAALHLAELRHSAGLPVRIVLLERDRVASGPSGKSAGHVCGLQATDDAIRNHCGSAAAEALIQAAADATRLVRTLIERYEIPCDPRYGYVIIHADGRQTVSEGGAAFGIDPYPFALGLAHAAARLGVEIQEGVTVTGIEGSSGVYHLTTTEGKIPASLVLASGGHQMAETIPLLASLRRRTVELRVATIITDPLPNAVLRRAMPGAGGRRFPFANDSSDVAYGSIDRVNRLVFGAFATAWRDPSPKKIMRVLAGLLPSLLPDYRDATGKDLAWRSLVAAEKLCFTRDLLPNVGAVAGHPNILYVNALGGHGIAIGTWLGMAAAEKLWGMQTGGETRGARFDSFAIIPHDRLPSWQPWRSLAAGIGLALLRRGRSG